MKIYYINQKTSKLLFDSSVVTLHLDPVTVGYALLGTYIALKFCYKVSIYNFGAYLDYLEACSLLVR